MHANGLTQQKIETLNRRKKFVLEVRKETYFPYGQLFGAACHARVCYWDMEQDFACKIHISKMFFRNTGHYLPPLFFASQFLIFCII